MTLAPTRSSRPSERFAWARCTKPDTRLERIVAVKVSKTQFRERFEREAHAIASLNHPSICTLHDVGPNYLVMEYIEGTSLKGPLPVAQAFKYAAQICDALEAAHTLAPGAASEAKRVVAVRRRGISLVMRRADSGGGPPKSSAAREF